MPAKETMTASLARLATALGWWVQTKPTTGWWYIQMNKDSKTTWRSYTSADPRDLDACLKAAEAALTEAQQEAYGLELARQLVTPGERTGPYLYRVATAPAEVRLAALLKVVEGG